MLIRLGYDISLSFLAPAPVTALLSVHPSRYADLREPDVVTTTPVVDIEQFIDLFGNRMTRFVAPAGDIRLQGHTLIEDSGLPDPFHWGAREVPVERLPPDTLRLPGPAMLATVTALAEAIRKLQEHDRVPFADPYRLDDAGWVANRWCELLPVPLGAKQKLMELDDPVIRLSLVDGFLRDKKVVVG